MKYKFITASVMMALSVAAFADEPRGGKIIDRLDQNGDELISIDEFRMPRGAPPLERADVDGDGIVTVEELMAQHEERAAKMRERMAERMAERDAEFAERIGKLDRDGDGTVSEAEARQSAFEHMDADGDGYLSASELRPRKGKQGPREGKHGPREGKSHRHGDRKG